MQHLEPPGSFEHLLKPRRLHIQFQGCSLIAPLAPTSTHRGTTVHFIPWCFPSHKSIVGIRVRVRVRVRLGGGVGGSVLVATPDTVHSTFMELQLLMPQQHIHIPPRPLLFSRFNPTKNELRGRLRLRRRVN